MMRWLVVVSLAAGCAGRGPSATGAPRVVSLHDVTSELIVALGAVDRLAGVDEPVDVTAEDAAALARVPRVGDLESILAVRPTLVIGLAITAAKDPELVTRLRGAGVEVYLADPRTLDDVYAMIRAVGARLGDGAAADRLAQRMASQAAALGTVSGRRTRVFVYDCCDPPFTAGAQSVLGDLIARAGGDNVFADVDAKWTHVSWEQVVARRPELVVIDAYAFAGQGELADKRRAVAAISALAGLPTVTMPLRDALGGLHSIEGLALLRQAMRSGS
jgi:iron complex transport system substrate-binding protein